MNVLRVIYLDQNLVVNVCECMRPSKHTGRDENRELRSEIERCVDDGLAVFPFSEVHLCEAANVMDAESRAEQIRFWHKASKGFRFHDAKVIQRIQLEALLRRSPMRFGRDMAIHKSQLDFGEELPAPDPRGKSRGEVFRDLVRRWANKPLDQLRGVVHQKEVDGMVRLIWEDLQTLLRTGELPFNRIFSKHSDLHSEVCEYLRGQGSTTEFEDACAWLSENALKIPAIGLNFLGTEYIAEEFRADHQSPRKVEKANLDHDVNDLEALAHWFPYVDCAFTDRKMAVSVFPRLRKELAAKGAPFHLSNERPRVFWKATDLLRFLKEFQPGETVASVSSELRSDGGSTKSIFYVMHTPDPLIWREKVEDNGPINGEILPGGGLRLDGYGEVSWQAMVDAFRGIDHYVPKDAKAARFVAVDWNHVAPRVGTLFLSFGNYSLTLDDLADRISTALRQDADGVREILDPAPA